MTSQAERNPAETRPRDCLERAAANAPRPALQGGCGSGPQRPPARPGGAGRLLEPELCSFAEQLAAATGAACCWLGADDGRLLPSGECTPEASALAARFAQMAGGAGPALPSGEMAAFRRSAAVNGRLAEFRIFGAGGWTAVLALDGPAALPERDIQIRQAAALVFGRLADRTQSRGLQAELEAAETTVARLRRQVRTDALTGVANTRAFQQGARARLDNRATAQCLILVDIDHFKRVNDVFGHAFGDRYLTSVARALLAACPEDALIGRIGGDEFAILAALPDPGRAYMSDLLSRCRSSVLRAGALLGRPELGRISMGVSLFPGQADSYPALFEKADAALYAAKAAGRAATQLYQPERHAFFNSRELARQFRSACQESRITPHFQPVVDLQSGACTGFELLVRWHGPDGSVKLPSEFSAIFRDPQTAELLTGSIIREGLGHFGRWLARTGDAARTARLAVNLTAFDLLNPEFVFDLQSELGLRGLDWSRITIEITENVILGDCNGQIHRHLQELRARGARLAMDDFGTGHGGLQHLRDWPIDILKIDRQFVQRIDGSLRDRAVTEAILAIAGRCGFEVVAEGIETPAQLAVLQEMGCGRGQGFLLGRPMPPEALPGAAAQTDLAALMQADPALRAGSGRA
ncbi:bifunctional diguanylate cyclase/phosphodiesterase [Poseidonocella sp. HB161398]|uniref:putative bifunctional diguanylate cyclase/phosphodiesterase n=1 Tax=Poseidonocella sp. HB161398 TaxID=2320855 RepID=UPI001107EC4C|nr:GGDEF domain-containing phosphodiesterase [Poseidonocella sp. HB161398]